MPKTRTRTAAERNERLCPELLWRQVEIRQDEGGVSFTLPVRHSRQARLLLVGGAFVWLVSGAFGVLAFGFGLARGVRLIRGGTSGRPAAIDVLTWIAILIGVGVPIVAVAVASTRGFGDVLAWMLSRPTIRVERGELSVLHSYAVQPNRHTNLADLVAIRVVGDAVLNTGEMSAVTVSGSTHWLLKHRRDFLLAIAAELARNIGPHIRVESMEWLPLPDDLLEARRT